MTLTTRDAWADAAVVATQEVVDDHVAAVRRKLRLRRALVLVLELVALLAVLALVDHLIDPRSDALWTVPRQTMYAGFCLGALGFVLVAIGLARRGSGGQRFIDPADFLPRTDRVWLRTQIAEKRAVSGERHVVLAETARRMVAEGRFTPAYLGWVLVALSMIISSPLPGGLVLSSTLVVFMAVHGVRALVWSIRAQRWLALNA